MPERSAMPLARDRILDTTEAVLRRHGPAKTTVLDVSRALGVSHGTVYRHFPSKAALVEAVTERWLAQVIAPLAAIAEGPGPALPRMRGWFDALTNTKRQLASDDPEMFDTYVELMEQAPEMVQRHTGALLEQLTGVVTSGMRRGEIVAADPARTARAAFHAMSRFHHPMHRRYWTDPGMPEHYDAVWELVAAALAGASPLTAWRGSPGARLGLDPTGFRVDPPHPTPMQDTAATSSGGAEDDPAATRSADRGDSTQGSSTSLASVAATRRHDLTDAHRALLAPCCRRARRPVGRPTGADDSSSTASGGASASGCPARRAGVLRGRGRP